MRALDGCLEQLAVPDEPGGGADPPGQGPCPLRVLPAGGGRRRLRHLHTPGVDDLVGRVPDGVLDHPADELASLSGVQAVGVDEQSQLTCPGFRGRKGVASGDVIVVELGVEPGGLGHLIEAVDGPGELPVDDPYGQARSGHDVPGSEIAVADDGVGPLGAGEPRLPYGIGRGGEGGGGAVETPEQGAQGGDRLVAPGLRVDEFALDVGDDLVALGVEAVANDPGGAGEARGLQVTQQGVDRSGPGPRSPHDHVAEAVDLCAAGGQPDPVRRGEGRQVAILRPPDDEDELAPGSIGGASDLPHGEARSLKGVDDLSPVAEAQRRLRAEDGGISFEDERVTERDERWVYVGELHPGLDGANPGELDTSEALVPGPLLPSLPPGIADLEDEETIRS